MRAGAGGTSTGLFSGVLALLLSTAQLCSKAGTSDGAAARYGGHACVFVRECVCMCACVQACGVHPMGQKQPGTWPSTLTPGYPSQQV